MEVQAVTLDPDNLDELNELYEQAMSILDAESQADLRKYYHRVDSLRGLIGRLLARLLLHDKGVPLREMAFSKTQAGKPYIATPLHTPIGYNITHDNGVVAMAFSRGTDLFPDPPAYRIGVDVMLLQLPKRDTFPGFVEVYSEQLTDLERRILLPPLSDPPLSMHEQLRRFYLIWTLKEAYTKALGLGMGFDFSRIEYDVPQDIVRIDGVIPRGWEFTRFELKKEVAAGQIRDYVGVVARFAGGGVASDTRVLAAPASPEWLKVFDAADFLRMVTELLRGSG